MNNSHATGGVYQRISSNFNTVKSVPIRFEGWAIAEWNGGKELLSTSGHGFETRHHHHMEQFNRNWH